MMIKQEYITFTNFDTEKANAYLMNRNIELLERMMEDIHFDKTLLLESEENCEELTEETVTTK